jgi:hypothetical protein
MNTERVPSWLYNALKLAKEGHFSFPLLFGTIFDTFRCGESRDTRSLMPRITLSKSAKDPVPIALLLIVKNENVFEIRIHPTIKLFVIILLTTDEVYAGERLAMAIHSKDVTELIRNRNSVADPSSFLLRAFS